MGAAWQLGLEGFRVLIVELGELGLTSGALGDSADRPSSGAWALLRGVAAGPDVVDLGPALGLPGDERGAVGLVVMERAPGAELLAARDDAAMSTLRARISALTLSAGPPDLTLVVLPAGETGLGRASLISLVDAGVFIALESLGDIRALADLAQEALRARPSPVPTLRVEVRRGAHDGDEPSPGWISRWHATADVVLAPLPRSTKGLVKALREPVQKGRLDNLAKELRRRAGVFHHDLAERVREAEAEDLDGVLEDAFFALRAKDPKAARALFDAEIVPQSGTLLAGVAALRAVMRSPDVDFAELRHYANQVVQKQRWNTPTPLSEDILKAFDRLRATLNTGAVVTRPGRVLIDAADALCFSAAWRRLIEQPYEEPTKQALHLLMLAATLDLNSIDRLRLAIVYARHARLARDTSNYRLAKENLERCKPYVAEELWTNCANAVLNQFALVNEDEHIWHDVLQVATEAMTFAPASSHYALAIAFAHLGDRYTAETHLSKSIGLIPRFLGIALRDPDMRPLWENAGSPYYAGRVPKSHIH
ncbi:hypothetical protein L6R49_13070 [Myxococcota bacterium]|nr:hypothetical protein [Myxococcota bacterium]